MPRNKPGGGCGGSKSQKAKAARDQRNAAQEAALLTTPTVEPPLVSPKSTDGSPKRPKSPKTAHGVKKVHSPTIAKPPKPKLTLSWASPVFDLVYSLQCRRRDKPCSGKWTWGSMNGPPGERRHLGWYAGWDCRTNVKCNTIVLKAHLWGLRVADHVAGGRSDWTDSYIEEVAWPDRQWFRTMPCRACSRPVAHCSCGHFSDYNKWKPY